MGNSAATRRFSIAIFAHHRLQEQEGLAQQQDSRAAQHVHQQAEDPDDQSDWELDDDIVDYAWNSREQLMQQLQEQEQKEVPLPPIPEPSCAAEASLFLAQFQPNKRTPQELKRLLEARANPDIVISTETWGRITPLSKVHSLAKAAHVPIALH